MNRTDVGWYWVAKFFHSVILVFLSVHLLTGAFSCCNFLCICCNFLFLRNCHLHFIHARLLRVFKQSMSMCMSTVEKNLPCVQ